MQWSSVENKKKEKDEQGRERDEMEWRSLAMAKG